MSQSASTCSQGKPLNTKAPGVNEAQEHLKKQLCQHLECLDISWQREFFLSQMQAEARGAVITFDTYRKRSSQHNHGPAVQMDIICTAYQQTRKNEKLLLWKVEVTIDADDPRAVSKDNKPTHLPHFGYSIYMNGRRTCGPGHADIESVGPFHHRLGTQDRMHVIEKGVHQDEYEGPMPAQADQRPPCCIEFSKRIWVNGEDPHLKSYKLSGQSYNSEQKLL